MTPAEFTARARALRDERDAKLAAIDRAVTASKETRDAPPVDYWERQRDVQTAFTRESVRLMSTALYEVGYGEGVEALGDGE